jgi:uracil-DNA glycosylase
MIMVEFDAGPPPTVADHFDKLPSYAPHRDLFWYDWGPIFYRGRLDGSARVLCIASDPGPTERIAGRTLVGDAGQRVQGFLSKLGLTSSYACVNAYAYALLPSRAMSAIPMLSEPEHQSWRDELLSMITSPELQAVVSFGLQARIAAEQWTSAPAVMIKEVPHPSSRDAGKLITEWRAAVTDLRTVVTPDPDGTNAAANYGTKFAEADYAPIPRADLPFGVPSWLGDDSRGRQSHPQRRNTVERDPADLLHTLIWRAPDSSIPG